MCTGKWSRKSWPERLAIHSPVVARYRAFIEQGAPIAASVARLVADDDTFWLVQDFRRAPNMDGLLIATMLVAIVLSLTVYVARK
jgi:hypothetical protein